MQSAMWLILGGTVGLAALLDRHQHELMRINLADPVPCGDVWLQLPARWLIENSGAAGMITASESSTNPFEPALQVTVAPPAEGGLVDQLLRKQAPTFPPQAISFGKTGKTSGNLYVWQMPLDEDGQSYPFAKVIATAVLPNGPQVTIRLEHLGRNSQAMDLQDDVDLVRRIAATVKLSPGSAVQEQE